MRGWASGCSRGCRVRRRWPTRAKRSLKYLLEQAELEPTSTLRDRLDDHALHRQRWGAIGAGLGFGTAFAALVILGHFVDGQASDLIATSIGVLAAYQLLVGPGVCAVAGRSALSASARTRGSGVRAAAARMTDYLNRREADRRGGTRGDRMGVAGDRDDRRDRHALYGHGCLSRSLPLAWHWQEGCSQRRHLVLVLQRRLVSAPLTATDTDDLIVAAWRWSWDCATCTALPGRWRRRQPHCSMFVPDFSWWVLGAYVMVSAIVFALGFSNRRRRGLTPLAHNLTAARQRDVAAT